MKNDLGHRLFVVGAAVGIAGWMLLLVLLGFWYWWPVALPTITQPLPVLNEDHVVDVGEPIRLRLDVVKPTDLTTVATDRFITCDSGNLIPLASNPTSLPVGEYTIDADSVVLPPKALPGEVCILRYVITYRINPVREERLSMESEPFTVGEYPPGIIGTPLEAVR